MRKIISALVTTAAISAGASMAIPTAAQADTFNSGLRWSVSVSDLSNAKADGCYNVRFTLTNNTGDTIDLSGYVAEPDGSDALGGFIWVDADGYQTSSDTFEWCGAYDQYGTFSLQMDGDDYAPDFSYDYSISSYNTFTVTAPAPAPAPTPAPAPVHHTYGLTVAKTKAGTHGWRLTSTVRRDGRAWSNKAVSLQTKRRGHWVKIVSKWTAGNGKAVFKVTPARGAAKPYRVVISSPSRHSRTYYLRRR